MKELRYEIIFDPPDPPDPCPLSSMFDLFFEGCLELTDAAFILGQHNPTADGLIVRLDNDMYGMSDDLRHAAELKKVFMEFCKDADLLSEGVWHVSTELNAFKAEARAQAMEEPKDAAWQIRALEHSLEREKAWSQKLEEERDDLRKQLRIERRRAKRRLKRTRSHDLAPSALSQAIERSLKDPGRKTSEE